MKLQTSLRLLFALLLTALLPSCVVPKTVTTKCAWCKEPITSQRYMWDQLSHGVIKTDEMGRGSQIGNAPTFADAEQIMKKDALSDAITDDTYHFCSLRCLNSYKASTGIKEQRTRNVSHE